MKLPPIIPEEDNKGTKRKVLQRLELFELQRGFALDQPDFEETVSENDDQRKKTKKAKKNNEHESLVFKADNIASEYIAAGISLGQINQGLPPDRKSGQVSNETRPDNPAPPPSPPRWRPIGPSKIPDGQTYGSGRADVSGRVSCVAIDPSNSNHILCGSAAGGVWETFNAGVRWYPRTDNMPSLATGAIAFDPSSPNIVYVGTGEGNFYAAFGAGILRSTNGGSSWSLLTSDPFVGIGFFDLVVDPENSSELLAATTNGLYRSTDSGVTWTRRKANRTWKLSRSGGGTNEILAACSDGVHVSTNNGHTWTQVSLPGSPSGWRRLSVDHVLSDTRVAYAFGSAGSAKTPYLYRRKNDGNWERITSLPSDLNTGQDWYDWFLGAAPDRTDQVFLGAINAFRGNKSGTNWSWTNISAKSSGDSIHPDQHAISFHPTNPNVIFVGNDGGLYRSNNRGTNWTSLNTNLAITEIEYVAQDKGTHRWFMSGTQDNGTNRYNGSTVWKHIADGDGGDCAVNQTSPNSIFHSYFGMGLRRSDDRGDTWGSFIQNGRSRPGYNALFYPPMESRDNTICQAGESMFISRNNGNNWSEVALPQGVASSLYVPKSDNIFVGTTNGRIYRTNWNGSNWTTPTEITSPRTNAYLSDIHVDPSNRNRIWVTYSTIGNGRVFMTTNGGSTWNDRSNGLPNLPMRSVEVDPGNVNRVWVAADMGVYQSFNGGNTWSQFSLGLPNCLVGDLSYNHHTRILRAGTRNRGAWEIPVNGELREPICGRQWTGTLRPRETRSWFTFRWPATWHVIWTAMPTTVQSGAPQLSWNVQVERADPEYSTYWIKVKNLTDRNLSFEGRYCITSFY